MDHGRQCKMVMDTGRCQKLLIMVHTPTTPSSLMLIFTVIQSALLQVAVNINIRELHQTTQLIIQFQTSAKTTKSKPLYQTKE